MFLLMAFPLSRYPIWTHHSGIESFQIVDKLRLALGSRWFILIDPSLAKLADHVLQLWVDDGEAGLRRLYLLRQAALYRLLLSNCLLIRPVSQNGGGVASRVIIDWDAARHRHYAMYSVNFSSLLEFSSFSDSFCRIFAIRSFFIRSSFSSLIQKHDKRDTDGHETDIHVTQTSMWHRDALTYHCPSSAPSRSSPAPARIWLTAWLPRTWVSRTLSSIAQNHLSANRGRCLGVGVSHTSAAQQQYRNISTLAIDTWQSWHHCITGFICEPCELSYVGENAWEYILQFL